MSSGVCLSLPRGYLHVYGHNIQTTSSLKPLGQSSQTLCAASGKGNVNYIYGSGHMTKMAAMAINSKNFYKSCSSELEDL